MNVLMYYGEFSIIIEMAELRLRMEMSCRDHHLNDSPRVLSAMILIRNYQKIVRP